MRSRRRFRLRRFRFLRAARRRRYDNQQQSESRHAAACVERHGRGDELPRSRDRIQRGKIDRRILCSRQSPTPKRKQDAQKNQKAAHALLHHPHATLAWPYLPLNSL